MNFVTATVLAGIFFAACSVLTCFVMIFVMRWGKADFKPHEITALAGLTLLTSSVTLKCILDFLFIMKKHGSFEQLLIPDAPISFVDTFVDIVALVGLVFLARPLTERLFGAAWLRDSFLILSFFMTSIYIYISITYI